MSPSLHLSHTLHSSVNIVLIPKIISEFVAQLVASLRRTFVGQRSYPITVMTLFLSNFSYIINFVTEHVISQIGRISESFLFIRIVTFYVLLLLYFQ